MKHVVILKDSDVLTDEVMEKEFSIKTTMLN